MEHARNSAPHYSPRVGRIVKNGKVLGLFSNSFLRRFSQLTLNSLSFEEWTFTVTVAVADTLRKYAPSLTELCLWAVFQMCPDLCNFWFSPLTSHTHTHHQWPYKVVFLNRITHILKQLFFSSYVFSVVCGQTATEF